MLSHSQLPNSMLHVWLSIGYLSSFISQARVRVSLWLYRTFPSGKRRIIRFGTVMEWNTPSLRLRINTSGVHSRSNWLWFNVILYITDTSQIHHRYITDTSQIHRRYITDTSQIHNRYKRHIQGFLKVRYSNNRASLHKYSYYKPLVWKSPFLDWSSRH